MINPKRRISGRLLNIDNRHVSAITAGRTRAVATKNNSGMVRGRPARCCPLTIASAALVTIGMS